MSLHREAKDQLSIDMLDRMHSVMGLWNLERMHHRRDPQMNHEVILVRIGTVPDVFAVAAETL